MSWSSFEDFCWKELGLSTHPELMTTAELFVKEWDNWFPQGRDDDPEGTHDSDTMYQLAKGYVEKVGRNDSGQSPDNSHEDIVDEIEEFFAKRQSQERHQRRPKDRGGKRKYNEELKNYDKLELPDKDGHLKKMTQISPERPKRRSDRLKGREYVNLNQKAYYDKFFHPQRGPRRISDCHHSSNSEREEQQLQKSERLSTEFSDPRQIVSSEPTHSSQDAITVEIMGNRQLVDMEFIPTLEIEKKDPDNVSHHEVQPVMQLSMAKIIQRSLHQSNCDGIAEDLPHVESKSSTSTSSKRRTSTNRRAKPHNALMGSKDRYTHKNLRLNDGSEVVSSENGQIVDLESKEAPSSTGFYLSQDPAAATKDLGCATLAAQSLPHCPDNQLAPQGTTSRGSNTHSSLLADHSSMQEDGSISKERMSQVTALSTSDQDEVVDKTVRGEGSLCKEGMSQVTAPSENDQDELVDKTVRGEGSPSKEGMSQVTAPSESDQDEFDDKPDHIFGSGLLALTWILTSSKPVKGWVLWQGANLTEANLQFVFAAVMEHTGLKNIHSLEIQLDTPEHSYTFRTSREDLAHYETVKRFMNHIIGTSCREKYDSNMLPNVWISPLESRGI